MHRFQSRLIVRPFIGNHLVMLHDQQNSNRYGSLFMLPERPKCSGCCHQATEIRCPVIGLL